MNHQARITVLLVIYQSKIEDSNAYASIRELSDYFNVILIDNSTQEAMIRNNRDFSVHNHIHYLSKGENLGLSKAYNLGLDLILNNPDFGQWMLTLDQDTHLPLDYLEEIIKLSQGEAREVVYCPQVHSAQGKLSPTILGPAFTVSFDSSGLEYLACINSGLLWSIDLLKSLRYDEQLFLDMVDYDIFMQVHAHHRTSQIALMNCTIQQEFSGDAISTFIKDKTRFSIYSQDFVYFCRKWSIRPSYCRSVLFKRALKLSISHRSLWFLSTAIQRMKAA